MVEIVGLNFQVSAREILISPGTHMPAGPLMAGANPSFIASQMGHEDARMVYEVYSKWIGDINQYQVKC